MLALGLEQVAGHGSGLRSGSARRRRRGSGGQVEGGTATHLEDDHFDVVVRSRADGECARRVDWTSGFLYAGGESVGDGCKNDFGGVEN